MIHINRGSKGSSFMDKWLKKPDKRKKDDDEFATPAQQPKLEKWMIFKLTNNWRFTWL